jgi:hypothetical protein
MQEALILKPGIGRSAFPVLFWLGLPLLIACQIPEYPSAVRTVPIKETLVFEVGDCFWAADYLDTSPQHTFLVVKWKLTNNGSQPNALEAPWLNEHLAVNVADPSDRKFLPFRHTGSSLAEVLNPASSTEGTLVFDVPRNTYRLGLVVYDLSWRADPGRPDLIMPARLRRSINDGFWLGLEPRDREDEAHQPSSPGSSDGEGFSSNAQGDAVLARVQERLNKLGYDCGVVDGMMGPRTRGCIRAFQSQQGLPTTGELDAETRKRVTTSAP